MMCSVLAVLAAIAPLRIVPNKIVYPLNEAGYATVAVTNDDPAASAKARAVVTETWDLGEESRTVWSGEIVLGPGEGRSFRVAYPGSSRRYGHELRVAVETPGRSLTGDGSGSNSRSEYFNVNDDWWRVNQGCFIETPRDVVTPGVEHFLRYYGLSPADRGAWRVFASERWAKMPMGPFVAYHTLETRWQMQLASVGGNAAAAEKPDDALWYTPNAGGDRRRRTGDIRRDTRIAHDWGYHHTRYTIPFMEGTYGFELARKRPEFVLRNDRGQFQGLTAAGDPVAIADATGERRHGWTYVEANFFREDALDWALDDLVSCLTNLGEDGVYFDGRYMTKQGYDAFGRDLAKTHDVDACVVRNMRRSLEKIYAANPKAYVWSNGSRPENPEMALLDHPQSGLLHEVQWPFLLNPTRMDHSCRGYLDVLLAARDIAWRPGPYVRRPSKILHNGYLSPRWDLKFLLEHAESHVMAQHVMSILASVAAHPFAGGMAARSYKQMMTRYSELYWHEDLEIMKDGYRRFAIDSLREIWADDMIYRRETPEYVQYTVHLVNTPEQEFFDDAVTAEPPEADDVEVSTKLFAADRAKAWVIRPHDWLAERLEPVCVPVAAKAVNGEAVFAIPPFRYYSLLVIRVKKTGSVSGDGMRPVKLENRALNPVTFATPETAEKVTLVKGGRVAFAIVADTNREARVHVSLRSITPAVTRLRKFVALATGERPEVFASAKDVPAGKAILFVGKSADTDALGIDASKLPPEGFVVKTVGGSRAVAIVGNDSSVDPAFPEQRAKYAKGPRKATVFGVYDFMERVFGMRFFYPGPDGTLVPKLTDVVLPPCKYTDAPYLKNRGTYYMQLKAKDVSAAIGVPVTDEDIADFAYADRWSKTDSFTSMHSPFPEEWARVNTDKVDVAFFTNPQGHRYFNPKGHAGNYFDVTNLRFADALVESCHRYYDSKGRDRQGFSYNDGSYITFGQCDNEVELDEMREHPTVKRLGLITEENVRAGKSGYYSDVYGRFYKYLGERLQKEFPDKKLVVMPYSYYVMPPFQAKYRPLPSNVELGVCLGKAPRLISNPEVLADYRKQLHDWYLALGNRPVQQLWTYNAGNSIFMHAIATEEMGKFMRAMGGDLGRTEIFHEFGLFPAPPFAKGATACNFYPATYAGMRAFWNPDFDFEAAIDEHWEPFYGPGAGPHLREVQRILREAFFKFAVPKRDVKPLYPPAVLDALGRAFAAAEKALKPGTVEARRYETFAKLLKYEVKSQRGQHAYVVPRADVVRHTGDWTKAKPVKLMDPTGSGEAPVACPDVRLAWDEKGLYGRIVSRERPVVCDRDIWRGDVVEIFVCPGTEKAVNHQFCIGTKNRTQSMMREYKPFVRAPDWQWKCAGFISKTVETDRDWTVEFFIPFAGLKGSVPRAYDNWNFCFVYDKGPTPYASSCMNLGNNHNVERYGLIRFLGFGD